MILRPPKNPITLMINGILVDNAIANLFRRHLPLYTYKYTSGYRDEKKNAAVGGVSNSAHLYNLARDFIILKDGRFIGKEAQNQLFKNVIMPNWKGYGQTYTNTNHIHLNLDRDVTKAAAFGSMALLGLGGYAFFRHTEKGQKLWRQMKI